MGDGVIGGIGLTRLRVYDQRPGPDGQCSGSPHVHGVTDEAYYVVAGHGRVEMHDLKHGFRQAPLSPGQYMQFPPLVMHRLVSDDGLEILCIMANAGLAEAGDARVYFGPEVDADPQAYTRLMRMPAERGLDGALARRDRAVQAYQHLLILWQADRDAYERELRRFFRVHLQDVARRQVEWADVVEQGPMAWGRRAAKRLARPEDDALDEWPVRHSPQQGQTQLGMCGVLQPVRSLLPIEASDPSR